MSQKEILLTVDKDMILACVTEYDHKYVTENDAEILLSRMEQDICDWFYENVGTAIEESVVKYIHEVMNPGKDDVV